MIVSSLIGVILSTSMVVHAKDVLLKVGCQGEDVKVVQNSLKELGYFDSNATGYYGEITKSAVESFQRDRNFTVDGIVGSATWSSLVGEDKITVEEEISLPEEQPLIETLKVGIRNKQVITLQNRLTELGYFTSNATGYYGSLTKEAVEKYQAASGITVDGIVGDGTWGSLFKVCESVSTERSTVSRGTTTRDTSNGEKIVNYAKNFEGVRYVWGGNTSNGFDCSGFVKYVYSNFGIELNRVAADQAKQGTFIEKDNLSYGDLVFFDTNGGKNYINHVGIYIGNGLFIHASSSSGRVIISEIADGFYAKAFMTARTIIE